MTAALSLRGAVAELAARGPAHYRVHAAPMTRAAIGAHFAATAAGVPATRFTRAEPAVEYPVADADTPVLLGLYGDEDRVRGWLPGYPRPVNPGAARELLAAAWRPRCTHREAPAAPVDLSAFPALTLTSNDAGPYLTTGLVMAEGSLSVHRMLVLNRDRLTVWIVPGRGLGARHAAALARGEDLAVSVNLGAPPAAMVASATNGCFLPPDVDKLALAGALAGAPLAVAPAATQPVDVLAESEIVLEGRLGCELADETLDGEVRGSLPEFLGYPGSARPQLPVLTVTGVSRRPGAVLEAMVGPGREQSVVLGLGGALSVALSGLPGLSTAGGRADWSLVRDLHLGAAGGGMVLLAVALAKTAPEHDAAPARLARALFAVHPFVRTIVFVDPDVDLRSPEDLWWAVATRADLATDCVAVVGHPPVSAVPADLPAWRRHGDPKGPTTRTYLDATVPAMFGRAGWRALATPGIP